jgi:PAS domain S-box-containing protein/putative nucleotidyltransferase with HDIG domain
MIKPLRVLMVEDSEDDALLTIRELAKGGYEPVYERVETAGAMRTALREKAWDVILCDYRLPQFNGLAAIGLLKETDIDIPLIIVSGAIGEETAVECLRLGAHDYVMKGNLSRLVPAIERELREAESRVNLKRMEEELRESEANYRQLFDNSPAAIYQIDFRTGKFLKANDVVCEYLGCSQEEIPSLTPYDFMSKESQKLFLERLNKMDLCDRVPEDPEYEIIDKNGKRRWVQLNSKNIYDSEGLAGADVVAHDITERKRAEENLRESEALFRSYLENAPDGIYMSDLEGNFLYGNRKCEEIVGCRREELIGKNFLALNILPEDSLSKAIRVLQANMEGKSTGPDEVELISKGGRRIPLEINTSVVQHMGQRIVLSFVHDITERKRSEEELQRTLESLRKAVSTTIQVMVSAVETRDPYTAGHQIRSADLARAIATEMGLPQEKIDGVRMAGFVHDIGKLSIPAEILSKPTKLSEIEFSLIKEHAQQGFEILRGVESSWPLADMVYQHHERMDGSGYPRNLKGEEILMEARILAVADVVESMASHRPYRAALGVDAALEEISKNRGILYDPEATDACLRLFQEKGYRLN